MVGVPSQHPMPVTAWVRRGVLAAVLLDLALVGGRVALYRPLLAQPGGGRYVLEPIVLLLLYAGLGAWAGTTGNPPRQTALRIGTAVGLLTGALWLVNLALETFTDLGSRAGLLATAPFLLGAFTIWGVAGAVGAWQTRSVRHGVLAAVLGAMLCVLITVTFGRCRLLAPAPGTTYCRAPGRRRERTGARMAGATRARRALSGACRERQRAKIIAIGS